jgi:hypothetical protein
MTLRNPDLGKNGGRSRESRDRANEKKKLKRQTDPKANEENRARAREWYHANKEQAKENNQRFQRKARHDTAFLAKKRRVARDYYWANRDAMLRKAALRRRLHGAKIRASGMEWYYRNKRQHGRYVKQAKEKIKSWVNDIKLTRGCEHPDCPGHPDHSAALCFHHRDPAKKSFEISDKFKYSRAVMEAEIAKCDVLCHNCHAVVEWQIRQDGLDCKKNWPSNGQVKKAEPEVEPEPQIDLFDWRE